MEKNYLPSRQFVIRLVAILGLVILAFVVDKVFVYFRNKPGSALAPTPLAVKDIVQKDSNNNGIADWEETLWGLDPTKDGDANREFINNKRAQLAQNAANDPYSVSQSTPENQALAQEFFAVVMSLQQTGDLDNTALSAIGDTIGKNIVAPTLPDIYTKNMLTIIPSTNADDYEIAVIKYYTAYVNLTKKYQNKNIGDELTFISVALKNNDQGALTQVGKVAQAYRAFGKELASIPVPATLADTQLSLANNYEKTAQSIEGLAQLLTDPIAGMKGLINYKKYSDALISDMGTLTDKFSTEVVQ